MCLSRAIKRRVCGERKIKDNKIIKSGKRRRWGERDKRSEEGGEREGRREGREERGERGERREERRGRREE